FGKITSIAPMRLSGRNAATTAASQPFQLASYSPVAVLAPSMDDMISAAFSGPLDSPDAILIYTQPIDSLTKAGYYRFVYSRLPITIVSRYDVLVILDVERKHSTLLAWNLKGLMSQGELMKSGNDLSMSVRWAAILALACAAWAAGAQEKSSS